MPKLDLTSVETMILADVMSTDLIKEMSGVNLLFLAPELFQGDVETDWKVDVWSIGQILYLLVTGGVDAAEQGNHYERRDFMEPIWPNVDKSLTDFIELTMVENPDHRASIDQLFKSDFIKRHERRMLPNNIISLDLDVDLKPNMYKFYVAYFMNELVCRNKKNIIKRYTIGETWDHFAALKRKEREERIRQRNQAAD